MEPDPSIGDVCIVPVSAWNVTTVASVVIKKRSLSPAYFSNISKRLEC